MPEIFALVDYDNQRQGIHRSGTHGMAGVNFRDHEDFLHALIAGLLDYRTHESHRLVGTFSELRIRLYGGWIDSDGNSTEMGDMVSKAIGRVGASSRVRETRLFIELADRLLCMGEDRFTGTFRLTPWLGARIQCRQKPTECLTPQACPHIATALAWAAGKCPERTHCNAKTKNAFLIESQKLVDTMITSDAFLAYTKKASEILAVSMDDDIIPGVLAVAALSGAISVVRFGKVKQGLHDGLLALYKVPVVDLPKLG